MPRRTATPATPAPSAPLPPPPRDLALLDQKDPEWATNLRTLRRLWKWANFSQFFHTFAPLLAMPDVFLSDVEDDLARGTNLYLPRIMYRLLYILSQDRKLNINNWQTVLRRQYMRRNPTANPIGPEPKAPSRSSSFAPTEDDEDEVKKAGSDVQSEPRNDAMNTDEDHNSDSGLSAHNNQPRDAETSFRTKAEPNAEDDTIPDDKESNLEPVNSPKDEQQEESKDWLELPMLEKLDSLHLLTEWQFHNPYRLRQMMKDDDEMANWRIEPIGYDAKTNAYWLIGLDRLWIQRAPPKSPRSRALKRKRPTASPKKRVRDDESSFDEDEEIEPVSRSKRTRTQPQSHSKFTASQSNTNGRPTRTTRRRSSGLDTDVISPGKSTRAAKVQANKKLDMQARELAEFQRQAAALARSSPRKTRASASPAKRPAGTRVSARLRHAGGEGDEDDADDEWQQVPEEWLQEDSSASRRTSTRSRGGKGKVSPEVDEEEAEQDEGSSAEQEEPVVEDAVQEQAKERALGEGDDKGREGRDEEGGVIADNENIGLLQKAGLESGSVSDLTDLSDQEAELRAEEQEQEQGQDEEEYEEQEQEQEEEEEEEDEDEEDEEEDEPKKARRKRPRKAAFGVRRSSRRDRKSGFVNEQRLAVKQVTKETEPDPEEEQNLTLPPDFVEWEAIAITLSEWEHVASPFEKATHYLEKALYKMLTQNIVPVVTEELQEVERRRRLEDSIVHRKRSSRIAMKESEKEEARLAAKRKAEEEDKLARTRRQEARRKKEETDRVKRERAREERAKERDAREARARAKAERQDQDEDPTATGTSSISGTRPSSSMQQSRVVSPNGVRTPEWILDCEVCHKQGLNMDDGLPMVSCGSCNRWQHIVCHDHMDQRAGRPRRDWDKQQFFCIRCRQRAANGGAYGGSRTQPLPAHQQPYVLQDTRGPIHLQKPGGMDPFARSNQHYGHRSPIDGYSQQYMPNSPPPVSYPRAYSNTGLTYNSHQPEQHGLSRPALPSPQGSWSAASNGYSSRPEVMPARIQTSHFVPQYPYSGGGYAGNRIPSAYPNHSSPSATLPTYNGSHDHVGSVASSRWQPPVSNGYHPPNHSAVQEAAQSLAFMHDGVGRYSSSSSGWPAQSSSYGQHSPTSSHLLHSYPHLQAPPPTNIDPLTGQPFR